MAEQEFGFFEGGGFFGFTGLLEFGEALLVFGDHAIDAGFVEGDVGEAGVFVMPGAGLSYSGFYFRGVGEGGGFAFFVAEAEGVEFDGAGAIDAPLVLRDGDGELVFVGSDGFEGGDEALFEGFVGEAVGFVHDEELAGEAMAAGVHGGVGFAGFGAGAGGFLSVAEVGEELGLGEGFVGLIFGVFDVLVGHGWSRFPGPRVGVPD